MLRNPNLLEVWCESLDDITLIWNDNGVVTVEFVQVKAGDIGQMWTVPRICEGGVTSLVGRSLIQHRCSEPCYFRVVTRLGIHSDLHVLRLKNDAFRDLTIHMQKVNEKFGRKTGNELKTLIYETFSEEVAEQPLGSVIGDVQT